MEFLIADSGFDKDDLATVYSKKGIELIVKPEKM